MKCTFPCATVSQTFRAHWLYQQFKLQQPQAGHHLTRGGMISNIGAVWFIPQSFDSNRADAALRPIVEAN